ncbi:MAG: glycosyltransferase family 4 protein [Actinobacteria bacterium]|nr:glycosyltransferase family 4 protein [Actinomycetota bacterium]
MRILLVSPPWIRVPPLGYGGIEWVVSLLADELASRGHDVTLFATGDSTTKANLKYLFKEGQTSKLGMVIYDSMQVSESFKIAHKYDIVHDHSGYQGVAFSHTIKTPMLHTLHGPFTVDTIAFYSHFKDACYFNAISKYQKNCLQVLNYVDTVYNAIDVYNYEYSEDKENYLVLISRVNPNKGTHLAIKVARELGEKLVLVGKIDPPDMEYFKTQVEPEVDGKQIIFKGELGEIEKRRLLKKAKCFIFPIQWPEPFGLVMAEAMACGTPVVALRNGSSPEVVEHGKVGYVVDTLNEMVEAVKMVSDIDPRACRDYVLANFSPEKMADGYEKNYRKILEQR